MTFLEQRKAIQKIEKQRATMLQISERGLACSAFYSWNETAVKSSYGAFSQRYFSYKVLNLLELFFLSVAEF